MSTIQLTNTVINNPIVKNEQSEDSEEMELFITSVKSQLEIFVNRIKSNLSRGRTVINGGSLETFYSKITPMHQKLLQYIQQQDEKRRKCLVKKMSCLLLCFILIGLSESNLTSLIFSTYKQTFHSSFYNSDSFYCSPSIDKTSKIIRILCNQTIKNKFNFHFSVF